MGKLHDVTTAPMTRPALEVARIFRHHGPEYPQDPGLVHDDDYENVLRNSHNRLLHIIN